MKHLHGRKYNNMYKWPLVSYSYMVCALLMCTSQTYLRYLIYVYVFVAL